MSLKNNESAGQVKVSILTVTYNQEKYIRQALESFINQKTNFSFEAIIADDHSTDRTANIIKEYAEEYPNIIKPIYRKQNVGALKNFVSALKSVKSDYLAICDGDDYWLDEKKLQKQADFLDENKDYALCFHPAKVIFEHKEAKEFIFPDRKQDFNTAELLKSNFIQTNSVMYRRQNYDRIPDDVMPLDWYLHLFHAQFGEIGFIDDVMSAYRKHAGGIWWESYRGADKLWEKHWSSHIKLHDELLKLYGKNKDYREIINQSMCNFAVLLTNLGSTNNLVLKLVSDYPNDTDVIIRQFAKQLKDVKKSAEQQVRALDHHSVEQAKIITHLTGINEALKNENDYLKSKSLIRLENTLKNRLRTLSSKRGQNNK